MRDDRGRNAGTAPTGFDTQSASLTLAAASPDVSVGDRSKEFPLSPDDFGLDEGAFSLLVVALSPVPWAVAWGASILENTITNAVTIVGGSVSIAVFDKLLSTAVERPRVGTVPSV